MYHSARLEPPKPKSQSNQDGNLPKEGAKRFTASQVIFAGDPNEHRTATFMEKFADLDAGPAVVRVLAQTEPRISCRRRPAS